MLPLTTTGVGAVTTVGPWVTVSVLTTPTDQSGKRTASCLWWWWCTVCASTFELRSFAIVPTFEACSIASLASSFACKSSKYVSLEVYSIFLIVLSRTSFIFNCLSTGSISATLPEIVLLEDSAYCFFAFFWSFLSLELSVTSAIFWRIPSITGSRPCMIFSLFSRERTIGILSEIFWTHYVTFLTSFSFPS